MIYRSKAPLRIGLAGGGTDVSPYRDTYGGAVLNATISLYAKAFLQPLEEKKIYLEASDRREAAVYAFEETLPPDGRFDLHKGVYNCIQNDFGPFSQGFRLSTCVDVPPGSGLGSSSTLAVVMVAAFADMLQLPLNTYDIAHYAYQVERHYLNWTGGKQDQYAACFGGFNFMEFHKNDKVTVTPLQLQPQVLSELENNLLLYYTATGRQPEGIIEEQARNVMEKKAEPLEAMHLLKRQALMLKDALLAGNLNDIGEILDYGFQQKRKMATGISNPFLEERYAAALKAGATGGKISGAGGGGFMLFYCPGATKDAVRESLQKFGGYQQPFQFVGQGVTNRHS